MTACYGVRVTCKQASIMCIQVFIAKMYINRIESIMDQFNMNTAMKCLVGFSRIQY